MLHLGLLMPRARNVNRRVRRRQLWNGTVALLILPCIAVSPDRVVAWHNEAHLYCGMSAITLALPGATSTTFTYAYDDNGNTLSRSSEDGTNTYAYDFENRLVAADIQLGAEAGPVSYTYDADGVRRSKTIDGATTEYFTDKNRPYAQVLLEQTAGDTIAYTYGDDLISMKRSTGTNYYHYDGQLSARQLTGTAATVTDTYSYDAFGVPLTSTGSTPNNYRYTGEQYDPNVGFYYLRARYMDPATGRFVTRDPFDGFAQDPLSLHKYLYAHADPANRVDPSGLFSLIELMVVVVLVGIPFAGLAMLQGDVNKMTPKQRLVNETALDIARFAILRWLSAGPRGPQHLFGMWFDFSVSAHAGNWRTDYVKFCLERTHRGLFLAELINDPKFTSKKEFAHEAPNDGVVKIWLGPKYWTAKMSGGWNTKWGTLIHETTHERKICGTSDHAYGEQKCLKLSIYEPDKAVNNADSYEYAVEDMLF